MQLTSTLVIMQISKKIVESNDRKKELNDLVKKRHLKEREELTMQLQDTHEIIRQKDMKISVRILASKQYRHSGTILHLCAN